MVAKLKAEAYACVDSSLGMYQLKLFVVTTRWSGNRRGEGTESVVKQYEVSPRPKILFSLTLDNESIGRIESGAMSVEISITVPTKELVPDTTDKESFWWEVHFEDGSRRRFFPTSPPVSNQGETMYKMTAERNYEDRLDSGKIDDTPSFIPRMR